MKSIVLFLLVFICYPCKSQVWVSSSGYVRNDTGNIGYATARVDFSHDSFVVLRNVYRDTTYNVVYEVRQKDSIIIYDHLRFMQDKCNKLSDKYAKKSQEAFMRNEMAKGAHNMMKSSYFEGMSDTYVELIYLRKWETDGKKHTIKITSYE